MTRMTTQQWMIVVAGSSVVFACFGVNAVAAIVIMAFVISALIAKPSSRQDWIILLIGGLTALPWMGIAYVSGFNLRPRFVSILAPTIVSVLLTWIVYSWAQDRGPTLSLFRALVMLAALWWLAPIFFVFVLVD
jgi:fluoride ion exporter CrcB/FEX